jgi:aliphatic nitrilase
MVGQIFADQIEVTIRHHALESGCFFVNATGYLTPEQRAEIAKGTQLESALNGGCFTAIVSPEGNFLAPPLTDGEGMVVADLDMALITKRKRMMDSVGHYARPELLSLLVDRTPHAPLADRRRTERADRPIPAQKEIASHGDDIAADAAALA